MTSSVWSTIAKHLKDKGYDVYSPGVKVGECLSPYIVVKNNGSNVHQSFSTDVDLYSVMCYVPKTKYSTLEPMIQNVKESMKELAPMVLTYGQQTPSYYDDSIKAHTISIVYKNYKKL